jgi:arabinofuranosyltransferase
MSERARYSILIAVVATVIACIAWQFRLRFPFDDTFISFRYAEHLAAGHGLVWNIDGPHTEGYTNFLFILLLAACRFITSDLLVASQMIGLIGTTITAVAIFQLASNIRNTTKGFVAATLFILAPLTWINALSGMETSLFVMWVVLACGACFSLHLKQDKACATSFIFATLATLTRPEGALIAALLVLVFIVQDKDNSKHVIRNCLLFFVLPLGGYALWKLWYFGNLLPNSFYIKVSESSKWLPGLQYVRLFVTSILALIVASFGIRSYRAHPAVVVAGLWIVTLLVFYLFVTPLEGLYDRFLWPGYAALCITSAIGLHDIAHRLHIRSLPWLIAALHLVILFRSARTEQSLAAHEEVWDASMERIATSLRALPNSSSLTLAYGDAGYVAYRSGLKHLDLFGLNDTRIAHAHTPAERAAIIQQERPDLMLLPIRDSSGCTVFVEDAYGIANDSAYWQLASCEVFPYRLVLLLNQESPNASAIESAFVHELSSGFSIWKPPPVICRHSTR